MKPRIAVIGVRISWVSTARKSLFARLARSAASRARASSALADARWWIVAFLVRS